jgi:diketogulonate reductase-like aldo/keto reductase
MEQLREDGLTRSIGVSNFQQHHLEILFQSSCEKPVINQVEMHPYLQQHDLQRFCIQHSIILEAWAPLSRGLTFTDPVIIELAGKYDKTVAQIILRWDIQRGVITIPKSSRAERIKENCEIFDFRLEDADMNRIGQLDRHHRIGSDPDNFHF